MCQIRGVKFHKELQTNLIKVKPYKFILLNGIPCGLSAKPRPGEKSHFLKSSGTIGTFHRYSYADIVMFMMFPFMRQFG